MKGTSFINKITSKAQGVSIYELNGQIVVRKYSKKIRQPGTRNQQKNWDRMRKVNRFLKPLKPLLKLCFGEIVRKGTAYSTAMSYQLQHAIYSNQHSIDFDFSRASISRGSLQGVDHLKGELLDDGKLLITWKNERAKATLSDNDSVLIVVYFEESSQNELEILWQKDQFFRKDQQAVLHLPGKYYGSNFHVYVTLISEDEKQIANSEYVGSSEFR